MLSFFMQNVVVLNAVVLSVVAPTGLLGNYKLGVKIWLSKNVKLKKNWFKQALSLLLG